MVAMPALVLAMASGFAGDARFDLAVVFGRIAFPYIFFISLAALLSGVLNATGRFLAAAAAPVLLNVIFIAALYIGDHPLLFGDYRSKTITLDAASFDEADVQHRLSEMLGGRVHRVSIRKVDLVRDTTTVDVRYQVDRSNDTVRPRAPE